MKSRNKVILGIVGASIILVSIISFASGYITFSGFTTIEKRLAIDNANRVFHVSITNLDHIYLQNLDNAYWDDAYQFMKDHNKKFIKSNYPIDFFIDNKYNYMMLLDKTGKVAYATGFDSDNKKYIPIDPEVLKFFKTNAFKMLNNRDKYYQPIKRDYGLNGFIKIPGNGDIGYFALNFITDNNDVKPHIGSMVFGKALKNTYYQQLSKDLDYPISIIPLENFTNNPEGKKILNTLLPEGSVYTAPLDENTLISYKLIKDFNNKPIVVLRVDLPRNIYNQIKGSSFKNQLILLAFSLLVVFTMSALVYLFFRKQEAITHSFERFVPHRLIELLKKEDILAVSLGNNSKRIISVLFMDIRNFTTISEGLSSQENFDFINSILKEVAPIISNNNGFIDKYIGDAIMALFPNEESHADDAVKTAIMIIEKLELLNYQGKLKAPFPVKVGIGINTGESMLGIIGAEGRLEGTVISDMVNTASRIQNLTKSYDWPILISEYCYKAMKHPELYSIAHIDDVQVKGKTVKVSIYAVTELVV